MVEFLIGVGIAAILCILFEGTGSIAVSGSKRHGKYSRVADAKVQNILKDGTGSSKEELKEWWDTYHPPK